MQTENISNAYRSFFSEHDDEQETKTYVVTLTIEVVEGEGRRHPSTWHWEELIGEIVNDVYVRGV